MSLLWFCSHRGSRMHIRIDVTPGEYTFYVDGQRIYHEDIPDLNGGKIGLGFNTFYKPNLRLRDPSWDNIQVTDMETGSVLFSEDFSNDLSQWNIEEGSPYINKWEECACSTNLFMTAGNDSWSDYRIEADLYNSIESTLAFGIVADTFKGLLKIRNWREASAAISYHVDDRMTYQRIRPVVERPIENLKVIAVHFCISYFLGIGIVIAFVIIYFLFAGLAIICTISKASLRKANPSAP
ncbi:hypothetical protein JW979_05185 [bacterium]|nr:hypothetical protein [candidate division CSSED10-310 bacterium]